MPFTIRSSTIRLGIFISSLIIAAILVFQLVWLKKIYLFEQKEFDHSVVKAIRGLYEDLDIRIYDASPLNKLIENPKSDLYFIRITLPVNRDSLVTYLQYEFEEFGIFTDCQLSIYSIDSSKYIYTGVLTSPVTKSKTTFPQPQISRSFDHLRLYFPNRRQYILSQINIWIISSLILLIVLILFGTGLYYFYKQKFLNESQKDFLHSFTHEFKTPVSVLTLAADVLKDPEISKKPDKLATYAGIVEYQSAYLHTQIENLLRFANAESHHLRLRKEKINLHELIEEAITNLTPLIIEKRASLKFHPCSSDPCLMADRDYLVIVIMNLIDNAVKYSKDPTVSITTKNTTGFIDLSIQDNGVGIEPKELKNIFKKFFRLQNGEIYPAKGFGIGLSFVKKIVKAHGGLIKVMSSPGRGSNFIIELPVE